MKQSIPTIVITEQVHTAELLKRYIQDCESFSFLAETSDFSKAYNGIKELSKALGIEVIKIIGISDLGFAKALKKEIERGDF